MSATLAELHGLKDSVKMAWWHQRSLRPVHSTRAQALLPGVYPQEFRSGAEGGFLTAKGAGILDVGGFFTLDEKSWQEMTFHKSLYSSKELHDFSLNHAFLLITFDLMWTQMMMQVAYTTAFDELSSMPSLLLDLALERYQLLAGSLKASSSHSVCTEWKCLNFFVTHLQAIFILESQRMLVSDIFLRFPAVSSWARWWSMSIFFVGAEEVTRAAATKDTVPRNVGCSSGSSPGMWGSAHLSPSRPWLAMMMQNSNSLSIL